MGQAAKHFDYGPGNAIGLPAVDALGSSGLERGVNRVQERAVGRVQDRGTSALAVSIFADRSYLRAEMAEDAAAAGLRIAQTNDLGNLLGSEPSLALGDLVLVDCPVIDGAELAALPRPERCADPRHPQPGRPGHRAWPHARPRRQPGA